MTERLYRGKRKDNGEWVEGFLIVCDERYFILRTNEYESYFFAWLKENEFIFGRFIEVIPETVGQDTGLTDKNGKKIFEGDIVKFADIIGIINYNTGCYCVKTNKPDWRSRNNPAIDIVMNEYTNEIEIIGNIHDNPELLKGSEKKCT